MLASEIVKELLYIIETTGDLEVDISVAKQPAVKNQNYLIADARFILIDELLDEDNRIMIRDWPY